MRVLFIGDIVGNPGVGIVQRALPAFIAAENIDLVIANGENAAPGGLGITPGIYRKLRSAGVNGMTLGDHVYKKFDIASVMKKEDEPICKPANFPADAPGRPYFITRDKHDIPMAVFCLIGRTFMRPVDCPFQAADRVLEEIGDQAHCILVDIHAEATADKYLMANHLKGRVSAVLGTHTHIPTADEQIFPEGTAFITDVGMTGPYASILGRRVDRVLSTAVSFVPTSFEVASEDVRLGGALVDIDSDTGRATTIRRVMLDEAAVLSLTDTESQERQDGRSAPSEKEASIDSAAPS